ncbi:MAG: hypothetical protein K6F69_02685, partial [Treponema sp.]|nr:hypothetical protein [Treponema sp.]
MTNVNLLKGNIIKSIIIFALPLLVSYVFQQLYNAVDTVIVGNFLKESSLAAIGACTALYDLLIGFGVGFGNGMSIVAARAFGAGDSEKLKKIAASSIIITFIDKTFTPETSPEGYAGYTLSVSNLEGGHSGVAITKGGANAIKLMAD